MNTIHKVEGKGSTEAKQTPWKWSRYKALYLYSTGVGSAHLSFEICPTEKREWELRVNDVWHDTYATLRDAKFAATCIKSINIAPIAAIAKVEGL